MNYEIPCETLIRLWAITSKETPYTNSIRLEKNLAIASDDRLVVIEKLPFENPSEPIHIFMNDALLKQVKTESAFKSTLVVTAIPAINFASAKTTLGYSHTDNCGVFDLAADNPLERWRQFLPKQQNTESVGGMFWNTAEIELLGRASPSGCIVFEQFINVDHPVIVRDLNNADWFGMFIPSAVQREYSPATLPDWIST